MIYAALLLLIGGMMTYSLVTRATLGLDVLRDRNPTFVRLSDGSVRNGYTLKLMNHASGARTLVLTVEDVTGATLNAIGIGAGHEIAVPVDADKVHPLRVLVRIEPEEHPCAHRWTWNSC